MIDAKTLNPASPAATPSVTTGCSAGQASTFSPKSFTHGASDATRAVCSKTGNAVRLPGLLKYLRSVILRETRERIELSADIHGNLLELEA